MFRFTLLACIALTATGLWSQPGLADDELSLTIEAASAEAYLAEPLRIRVTVKNVSEDDVTVPVTWEAGYFHGVLTCGDSRAFWSFSLVGGWISKHNVLRLRPGQSYQRVTELVSIPDGQRPGPGVYMLHGRFESKGSVPNPGTGVPLPCWKGKITAKPFRLEIKKPPTKADEEALKVLAVPFGGVEKCHSFAEIWHLYPRDMYEGKDRRYLTVLEKYPDSVYAPYCRLSMALYHLSWPDVQGDHYVRGVGYVKQLLEMRPAFRLADAVKLTLARLYLAEAHLSLTATPAQRKELRAKARKQFKHVIEEYPTMPSVIVSRYVPLMWITGGRYDLRYPVAEAADTLLKSMDEHEPAASQATTAPDEKTR